MTMNDQNMQDAFRRIAELSLLLEDAEFMLRKIGNHPKHAFYMTDSVKRFCEDARTLLAVGRIGA